MIASTTNVSKPTRFGKTLLVLFGSGLPGIFLLIPTVIAQLDAPSPEILDLPAPLVASLSLLNPLILLAHRVDLRSLIAEWVRYDTAIWPQLRPYLGGALVVGLVLVVVVLRLDALIDPFVGTELDNDAGLPGEAPTLGAVFTLLALGILYGGIVEELLHWGVMTLFVWIGWRMVQRGQGTPRPALVWTANLLPALLFGWLFWRRNPETAMVAHAATHGGALS